MAPPTHRTRPAPPPAGYFERLRTPWWWYLAAVAVSALLGLEFALVIYGWAAWAPFVILLLASLLVVRRLSSGSVAVDGATLHAGEHSLALAEVEQVIDLDAAELRRLVGRHSDPLARTYIRSWIGPGVQLVLRPPADPQPDERYREPYWVVSTRHPDRLQAAIHAASKVS